MISRIKSAICTIAGNKIDDGENSSESLRRDECVKRDVIYKKTSIYRDIVNVIFMKETRSRVTKKSISCIKNNNARVSL